MQYEGKVTYDPSLPTHWPLVMLFWSKSNAFAKATASLLSEDVRLFPLTPNLEEKALAA